MKRMDPRVEHRPPPGATERNQVNPGYPGYPGYINQVQPNHGYPPYQSNLIQPLPYQFNHAQGYPRQPLQYTPHPYQQLYHQEFQPSYHQNQEFNQKYPNTPQDFIQPKSRTDSKFVLTRHGPVGSAGQSTAAASFYARNQTKMSAQLPKQVDRFGTNSSEEEEKLKTNFRAIICRAPPPIPSGLLARIENGEEGGLGKVRVIVRISSKKPREEERTRFFNVDKKKRQITLLDPTVGRGEIPIEERKVGVAAPKMFAYDGIYSSDDSQEEISTACLTDVVSAVINGNDSCLFCFGHSNLGKTYTMIGEDTCKNSVGVIPTAIAWLFKSIKERKQKTSARFSVRVSAVEISQEEELHDLLAKYASDSDQSPGVYLRNLPASQTCVLQNLAEVRASSVEKAAYYLDAALSGRSVDSQGREAHLLYTIHVYQYSVDRAGKGGVAGGRSRLHLIDFGGCERSQIPGNGITLSGLGNVILGIFNGQKHLPCRNSKLTGVLKECLSSLTCHATMIAHVSTEPSHYSESLHTLQLASRIHRMRRKRIKTGSSRGSTSSDENRRFGRTRSIDGKSGSSDFTTSTDPSSSEMSCNTVVYRGHSDGSGTDGEHPPPLHRFKRNLSGSRILTNGAISPRLSASPQPLSPASSQYLISGSPARLTPTLPPIKETSSLAKMPLNGKVPGYRQPAEIWIDGDRERQRSVPPATQKQVEKRYGFMDDFKANMINHWVENQKSRDDSGSLYLTQFKQADSDSGSEKVVSAQTQAEVHIPENSSVQQKKPTPPPPPPRRSSSKDKELQSYIPSQHPEGTLIQPEPVDKVGIDYLRVGDNPELESDLEPRIETDILLLNQRGETEGSDCSEPLPEPNFEHLFPKTIKGCGTQKEEVIYVRDYQSQVSESSLDKRDASRFNSLPRLDPSLMNQEHEHPLRILSEENLTVVSTFVADLEDLDDEDDEADEDCRASKLSFFGVPDYGACESDLQVSDDQYFENRLKELKRMAEHKDGRRNDDCDKTQTSGAVRSPFSDPRFKQYETKDSLSTFAPGADKPALPALTRTESRENSPPKSNELMTPQKQFQLLSQTLRRPDGSSNPDIDRVPPAKRSPGSGQSNSDPDEELMEIGTNQTQEVSVSPPEPITLIKEPVLKKEQKKKEMSNIAHLLLRIFGSSRKKNSKKNDPKRSKSCERELEETPQPGFYKNIKSASSSPLKRADRRERVKTDKGSEKQSQKHGNPDTFLLTPSTLSLATEWEFQNKEDELNGNQERDENDCRNENRFLHPEFAYQYSSVLQRQERKSSGYDSFEGENSSLDSGNGNPGDRTDGCYSGYQDVLGGGRMVEYSVPQLYSELDEITLLKLEINRHPDILNKNY